MFFLSLSLWIVVLFSLRISFFGNPAYRLLDAVPSAVLHNASQCLADAEVPEDDHVRFFLSRFFRWTAISCFVFVLELIVVAYFLFTEPQLIIPWIIFGKNMGMLFLSQCFRWNECNDVFERVQSMPSWLIRLERGGYFLTGVGFLILFLRVNGIISSP